MKQVQEYFNQRLDPDSVMKIPSLNDVPVYHLASGCVVRYRCMVQDVFDPQYCLGRYRIVDKSSGSSRVECGVYRDVPNIAPHEELDFDSSENVTVERHGYYCVPIPGESDWVKQTYCKAGLGSKVPSSAPSTQSAGSLKRPMDSEDDNHNVDQRSSKLPASGIPDTGVTDVHMEQSNGHETPGSDAHAKINGVPAGIPASEVNLNLPLPEEKGTPCIVRVYTSEVELKTTDAVEFVGILSVDPQLASISDNTDESEEMFLQEELQAHEPPPSLVPRLHAISARLLQHNNPLIPLSQRPERKTSDVDNLLHDVTSIRGELLSVLEHGLLGDSVAAEFVLCHLMASVYTRADVMPIGKLCVNLSGCPDVQKYPRFLHHLLSQLLTQSVFLEMSIENLNKWKLIPKKDYKANRVNAGMLQLSSGSHLFLNETALQQGQLNNTGVLNVKALADVINWQKVEYDFQWNTVPINTDVNVLILSEGPSMLPKDVQLRMVPNNSVVDVADHFSKLDARLTEDVMNKFRSYITVCRQITYNVDDDVQKLIQDDFVETRQRDMSKMTVDDFQGLLTLVRLVTLSFGKSSPDADLWLKVKAMDEERKARSAK